MIFSFFDDFLKFFLPILDDERQMRLQELDEDDPLSNDLNFKRCSDDDYSENLWTD
jgi:hypothetical protein